MIWDNSQNIIWLVDFERYLCLRDCPVEQALFNRYVRSYSREEFSCFLTRTEQAVLLDGFLDEDIYGSIPVELITSTRKRALIKVMFGEKLCYPIDNIRKAEDFMAVAATPFLVNGIFFFPMDSLDLIGNMGGPNEYTKTIIAIHELDDYRKFLYLKKCTKTLREFLSSYQQIWRKNSVIRKTWNRYAY